MLLRSPNKNAIKEGLNLDFVAIDFETANSKPNSACQLAAVVVRDAEIIDELCWLIRPPARYFAPRNIEVHGIRPSDVADAPNMEAVWDALHPVINGQVIIAHNARFDINVLIHSLSSYEIACPDLEFNCTRSLARAAWPGKSGYGLKPLGISLGIDFKHHDALEDARCCAQIALTIQKQFECPCLKTLESKLQISRGSYRLGQITSPRGRSRRAKEASGSRNFTDRWGFPSKANRISAGSIDQQAVLHAANGDKPLAGKHILFLGPLRGMNHEETEAFAQSLGALVDATLTHQTHYVIACGTTLEDAQQKITINNKQTTAPESTPQPLGIRLLSERQFVALLPGGNASVR